MALTKHRIIVALLHILHIITTLVVLILAVYLLKHFPRGAFEPRLQGVNTPRAILLSAIDLLLMLPILGVSLSRHNKNFLGFFTFLLGVGWVVLFVYVLKDFTFGRFGLCESLPYALFNGRPDYARCKIKRVFSAFIGLAAVTNFLATICYCMWRVADEY
ncbi:hypothetical protein A1F97_01514 [Pyrenophora tritici-repentis]|nr:DUF3397 domain containing protein [Pyrenophora tritici-repentis]PZD45309.1 hypothetical protein A1F97_01514 [Pyrenophora tritici-repentis]